MLAHKYHGTKSRKSCDTKTTVKIWRKLMTQKHINLLLLYLYQWCLFTTYFQVYSLFFNRLLELVQGVC